MSAFNVKNATYESLSLASGIVAGVLQGAVFGLVKAAIGRVTATSYRRFTGHVLAR